MTQEELDIDLRCACKYGDLDKVKKLIDKGANVNAKNEYGWTPLHIAAWKGHPKVVKLLIKAGAKVNATKDDGWTPLHLAARWGNTEISKLLIDKGANVNATNDDGDTPLHYAAKYGHIEIVEILEQAMNEGCSVMTQEQLNEDLIQACRYGKYDVAEYLIEKVANVINYKNGNTPLHWAACNGYTEIVKLLEQAVDTRIMIINQVMNQQAVKWKTLSEIGLSLSEDFTFADMCKEIKNMSSLLKQMDDKINKFLGR